MKILSKKSFYILYVVVKKETFIKLSLISAELCKTRYFGVGAKIIFETVIVGVRLGKQR